MLVVDYNLDLLESFPPNLAMKQANVALFYFQGHYQYMMVNMLIFNSLHDMVSLLMMMRDLDCNWDSEHTLKAPICYLFLLQDLFSLEKLTRHYQDCKLEKNMPSKLEINIYFQSHLHHTQERMVYTKEMKDCEGNDQGMHMMVNILNDDQEKIQLHTSINHPQVFYNIQKSVLL